MRLAALALALALAACSDDAGAPDSAPADAPVVDAPGDGPEIDGAPPLDAPADGPAVDAPPLLDAAPDAFSWGSCTVGGEDGQCVDVADCGDGYQSTPGLCPGPTEIQCCTPIPAGACDPSAVPQPNAGLAEAAGEAECPPGMIPVDTFCVDRYEAALLLIHDDGSSEPWSPYWNPGAARVRAVSIAGAVPQGYISGAQAEDACAEAGKRLCSDAEWLRACQGPAGFTYPYGDARDPGVCNDARAVHPIIELYGADASFSSAEMSNPCVNQLEASLDPAGASAGCVSADGAFDMMGNLHEWTADPDGTFRGGFYVDTVINGDGCLYRTVAHTFGYWDYSTGFRCCAMRCGDSVCAADAGETAVTCPEDC